MAVEFETDSDGSIWRLISLEPLDLPYDQTALLLGNDPDQSLAGLRVRIPQSLGFGRVDIIPVSDWLYISRIDAVFTKDYRGGGDPRMAKVRILLSGKLQVEGSSLSINGAGAYLEVDPGERFNPYVLKAGPTRLVVINCRPDFFSDVANIALKDLPDPLAGLFRGGSDEPNLQYTALGPELLHAANDIMRAEASYPRELRNAFFNIKCLEIACAVVRDLTKQDTEATQGSLSPRDLNRVYEAWDILTEKFAHPPTVPELSRAVGLNRNKLKVGFKSVFGMSLSDYTMKCRMERAADMVSATELSIAEIAYSLGYDHPTNFSATFRAYHGLTPREVRRANRVQ